MPIDVYIAFLAASLVLIVVPGPVVTLLVSRSLAFGPRAGLIALAGTAVAMAAHLSVVTFGLGAALTLIGEWFAWLKWIGVAYLVWLGLRALHDALSSVPPEVQPLPRHGRLFWEGVAISATNPKPLLFYGAFFPQFIDPAAAALPQLALLCLSFFVIATLSDGAYALTAGRIGRRFQTMRARRWQNGLSGGVLLSAAAALSWARRPQL